MSAEAEIRRTRPATRTLGACIRVFLQHGSPALIAGLMVLTVAIRLWLGGFSTRELVAFPMVAVWWPLQEWGAHRWILHIHPRQVGRYKLDPYFARRHRQHHAHPSLFRDVFLPARVVLGAWLAFAPLLVWLFGPGPGMTGLLAVSTGALLYEWTRFSAHADRVPWTNWGRLIVRNHRLHHFHNEQRWFAFTVPQLDGWLRTGGEPATVPRSATVRTLGVDDESTSPTD
mgnify:CR=1 FL=1